MNSSGDLTPEMWNEFYESVMQFEDIEEDEFSHGYLKDGFVVTDNELEEPYNFTNV